MKRTAIYARISETDPKEDKASGQVADIEKFFAAHGYDVDNATVFSDDGISASTGVTRPAWLRMLDAIESGAFDVVLATEEERFSRGSRTDKADLFAACVDGHAFWHTIRDGIVTPTDEDAEFMSDLRDSLSRREVRRKTSRQRARYEKETEKGMPLWGVRPFGYNADRLTLKEEEAAHVRWAYEVILRGGKGDTLYSIIQRWNADGVRTVRGKLWTYATLQQLLKRPRNAGIVMRNGVEQVGVNAQWEPLVSREDLSTITDILTDEKRRTSPGRKPKYIGSSLIHCGVCGSTMRSASVKVKGVPTPHYKCAAKIEGRGLGERHVAIRTLAVYDKDGKKVRDGMDDLLREAVISAYLLSPGPELQTEDVAVSSIENELSVVRASRGRLIQLLKKGLVEEEEVSKDLLETKLAMEKLEEQLVAARRAHHSAAMTTDLRAGLFTSAQVSLEDAAAVSVALGERFDSLTVEQRKAHVKERLDVVVHPGRNNSRVSITIRD